MKRLTIILSLALISIICISAPRKARRRLQLAASGAFSPLDLDPVAWWQGENNVKDSGPNDLDGTWFNTASYTNGITGSAFYVSAGAPYILNDSKLSGFDDFTFSLWVKFESIESGYRHILSSYSITGDQRSWEVIRWIGGGGIGLILSTNGTSATIRLAEIHESSVSGEGFKLITWTRSGSTINSYLDGVFVSTSEFSGTLYATTATTAIGGFNSSGTTVGNRTEGAYDNVMIFDKALTVDQIIQIYEWRE